QGEDDQPHDGEDRDLPQCVETAEVHQDDVDDIGAAAFGIGVLQEPVGGEVSGRHRHHRVGNGGHARTAKEREPQVAPAPKARHA
ncbi:hypothetical protein DV959_14155, partial [Staphylococcus pseudintermedius]